MKARYTQVIDRFGRVVLPLEYRHALGVFAGGKYRIDRVSNYLVLTRDDDGMPLSELGHFTLTVEQLDIIGVQLRGACDLILVAARPSVIIGKVSNE